jgi:hypothetical protein
VTPLAGTLVVLIGRLLGCEQVSGLSRLSQQMPWELASAAGVRVVRGFLADALGRVVSRYRPPSPLSHYP